MWQTGYQQGLVGNGAEVIVNSHGPVGPGWDGDWGWGFFELFRILFLILIIGLIARLFPVIGDGPSRGRRLATAPGATGMPWRRGSDLSVDSYILHR